MVFVVNKSNKKPTGSPAGFLTTRKCRYDYERLCMKWRNHNSPDFKLPKRRFEGSASVRRTWVGVVAVDRSEATDQPAQQQKSSSASTSTESA